jgi:hypothetical protein
MSSCPLPGHQDDTPSFNLWAEDEDGFPIRFGCFGCAVTGDVVDAIQFARGVGFLEACRVAVDELVPALAASSWAPAERVAAPRSDPAIDADLRAVLDRIAGCDDLEAFLSSKYPDPGAILSYAYMAWGWGTFRTPAPTVYFPHRDWGRRFTGIRYRSIRKESTRWTERGSRFPALYGAWRDQGRPAVLLCEGETDTVWAAFQLARDSRPWDVLGLAAGAAQKPPEDAVARLRGRRVLLAFDSDMAGRIATARWREALDETLVVPIPEGEDVLSCGIPIQTLIEGAET